jgi:heme-degrading monooxygenase HmoA
MHAVVVHVTIGDFDRGREFLQREVVPRVSQAPGFVSGYWTRSEDSRNGLSMMVFDSEDAARGAAQMVQSAAPQDEGVTLDNVEVREVVASA